MKRKKKFVMHFDLSHIIMFNNYPATYTDTIGVPGKYSVVATYGGNDEFNQVSKSIKFNVSEAIVAPLDSVLSSSKVITTYGTSKDIIVTLKDSKGNLLVGRQIIVKLNNKKYYAYIQSDGRAKITIPSSLDVNVYTAKIIYGGETNILAKAIKIKVKVYKATPKITAGNAKYKFKDKTKKYVIILKTDKNKVYKKQKVYIKVNGKVYYAKTDYKGRATFKLTKLTKMGTFTAKMLYYGNSNYNAISKKVKITVK